MVGTEFSTSNNDKNEKTFLGHHNHLKRSKRGENGSRNKKRNRDSKSQSKFTTCAICSSVEDQTDFFTDFEQTYDDT